MNKELILNLADLLENLPEKNESCVSRDMLNLSPLGFNMSSYRDINNICGTTACIAGWACALVHGMEDLVTRDYWDISVEARTLLDLDQKTTYELFMGGYAPHRHRKITPKKAASCLRNLASYRVVDWTPYLRD